MSLNLSLPSLEYSIFVISLALSFKVFAAAVEVTDTFYTNENELMTALFQNYRRELRPLRNHGNPFVVHVDPQLTKIINLDELEEKLEILITLHMQWTDEFMVWDISKTNYIYFTALPMDMLWTPPLIVYNSLDNDAILDFSKMSAFVVAGGTVTASPGLKMTTSCPVDLRKFPFDTQRCVIRIGLAMDRSYIALSLGTPGDDLSKFVTYHNNSEWSNVQVESELISTIYIGEWINVTTEELVVTITADRNPTFYVIYLVIPSVLAAFVSVLVFLLPPESGERIGLSITVLLSYSVFLLMVSEFTPRGGDNTAFLAIYITVTGILSGLALVMNILIINVYHRNAREPLPAFLKMCFGKNKVSFSDDDDKMVNHWHKISRKCDSFFFAVFLTVIIISTMTFLLVILT